MDIRHSADIIKRVSKIMFEKHFLDIFHGSISARIEKNKFLINKRNAFFDELNFEDMILLYAKKDYRWSESSLDSDIHLNIYKNIVEAKYICYATPPYLTAYSLNHVNLEPQDYFGKTKFDNVFIYDIKQFDDWYERAPHEIYHYMQEKRTNFVIIKGYGVYVYERSAYELAKTIALLENSCKLLLLSSN